ncbi:patatin-like phospholipase domain-containing protein 7-like isoform X1 [Candidatus Magnetomorum sp. HK-1]|nr:patatin-like phospholipase domain-containing protein 7-like isoform X1 [Candidatus Magnetomorum sp. HK-1]
MKLIIPSYLIHYDFEKIVASTDLFGQLSRSALRDVMSELTHVHVRGGGTLYRINDPGDCMFIVITGRLLVYSILPDQSQKMITEIGPGEYVGELELIMEENRALTIKAIRDTELLKLSKLGFEHLVKKHPNALLHITQTVVKRIRKVAFSKEQSSSLRTITLLHAGTYWDINAFTESFIPVLEKQGATLVLTSERLDHFLGSGMSKVDFGRWDEKDNRIVEWLCEQERNYRFVVYQSDPGLTPWTRRCIRQADRILLLASARGSHEYNAVEHYIFGRARDTTNARIELIILHDDSVTRPTNTTRWLNKRSVMRHHHVQNYRIKHYERIVRFLTDNAVGLVLGGGGARGCAHIGVIQALQEAGIEFDMIGGTSAGSGIGALLAMRQDVITMRYQIREGFLEKKPFKRFSLPVYAIMDRLIVDQISKNWFGNLQIEDLWINFFCISTNLTNGEVVIHNKGPVWKATRSSSSLPGIFAPMVENHQILVDGGVLDNIPAAKMKSLCGGPVILVNVTPKKDLTVDFDYEHYPSPLKTLWSWVNPMINPIRVPSLMDIMMRVAGLSSLKKINAEEKISDLILNPPLENFGLLAFSEMDRIIDLGYKYTRDAIKDLKIKDPYDSIGQYRLVSMMKEKERDL